MTRAGSVATSPRPKHSSAAVLKPKFLIKALSFDYAFLGSRKKPSPADTDEGQGTTHFRPKR
jgi:hypothetical protein